MSASYPALTTVFTPPPACTREYWAMDARTGGRQAIQRRWSAPTPTYTACYAPGFYEDWGVFSPGMCPSSYTTAFMTATGGNTIAQCCPPYISTPMTVSLIGDETLKSTVISEGTADYFAYWAVYQEKDLSLFPSGYTPGTVVAAVNTTTSGNGSTETDQPAPSSGMSTGARIGIGVGVGIAVLLLLGAAIFFIRSHRRKKRDLGPRHGESEPLGGHEKPELEGSAGAALAQPVHDYRKAELDSGATRTINEVSGHSSSRAEPEADPRTTIRDFNASYDRYELDGSTEVSSKPER